MNPLRILLLSLALSWAINAHAANLQSMDYAAVGGTGNALLTNSVVQIGPVANRNLTSIIANNPNNTVEYIQLFNGAAGNVALGTTVPQAVIPLGSSGPTIVSLADSAAITFSGGLVAAATTTPTGTSAPSTGITVTIGYQ